MILADFSDESAINTWYVVNDDVMGGRSDATLKQQDNYMIFKGEISLDNNGRFSSIRSDFKARDISSYSTVVIELKGDGKTYQFRAKTSRYDRQSYVSYVETNGEWQTISINLADLYPVFRGYRMRMANFDGKLLEEIGILFGNKKAEAFELQIKSIILK
ncbi:MAG: CIA30 family protein [Flavobacteriaceae bacterium]|nr:CIA30 family protein [Flavobacteriaceae bacterium]